MKFLHDRICHGKDTIKDPLQENNYSYGKIEWDSSKCNQCDKCLQNCLTQALVRVGAEIKFKTDRCLFCHKCVEICPQKALKMTPDYKMAWRPADANDIKKKIYQKYKRSLTLRSVDTGSCNGCLLELNATQNTYYDLSRFGIQFTASPRHADGIVVTGAVTLNMKEALLKTYEALAEPKIVIASGTCAISKGIFENSYMVSENLDKILPVDLYIPGCPPSPAAIIYGILNLIKSK